MAAITPLNTVRLGLAFVPKSFKIFNSKTTLLKIFSVNKLTYNVPKNYYSYIKLNGLGFRAWNIGKHIILELGYSHYYCVQIPELLKTENIIVRKDKIFIFSPSKKLVSQFANFLVLLRPLNPYTQKGLRIKGKKVYRKSRKKERSR